MTITIDGQSEAARFFAHKKQLIETPFGTYGFNLNGVLITGFLNGENTIEQYNPAALESSKTPHDYGFTVVDTGGQCTAWRQDFELRGQPVHMLITDASGMTHAIDPVDRVLIGVYDQDGKDIKVWEQANWPLTEESPPTFIKT